MHKPTLLLLGALALAPSVSAQDAPPSGIEAAESERSRFCVGVLARLDTLDTQLQPLAARSQRLGAIGQAISIEERSVVESLNAADSTEAAVRDWFQADLALAQRYVDTRDESLVTERATAREAILQRVRDEIAALQTQGQAAIAATGDLPAESPACEGAILVRPVVLETCAGAATPLCEAAAATEPVQGYRFVPSASALWDVSEFRPWTDPGPLQVGPDGQLAGARTRGYARQGNLALTLTLAPLIQERATMDPAQLARLDAVVDSMGFENPHPDLVFAPTLGLRAVIPQPLAGETSYVLHFGEAEEAVVIWSRAAGTGEPIDANIVLNPERARMVVSGAPLNFTAIREVGPEDNETVFSVQFTGVNQARATGALLGYMTSQLGLDLARLVPPGGGS